MNAWIPAIDATAHFIVTAVINSLWEDALLVFAVWLLLRSLPNVNASTRYFSWLVVMIAALLVPLITTIPQAASTPAQAVVDSPTKFEHLDSQPQAAAAIAIHHSTRPAAALQAQSGGGRFRLPDRFHMRVPGWLATLLFLSWALAALVIGARLAVDLFKLERLKRDSLPLPVEFRDQMERWVKAAYGNAREVRLCVSEAIEVPVAVGLFDSMILLPKHLLEELSAGELDRISLHELAHLHRGDDWTNSVQRIVQTLLFFNPAVRFIGSQLDLEREVACDDWVLSLTGDVRPYATCLTRMAELTAWPHRALAAPGVFVTRKGISIRIERLLNKHRNARVNVAYGVPAAVALALAGFFVLANVVTPVIAYTAEPAAATVANVVHAVQNVKVTRVAPVPAVKGPSPKPTVPPVKTRWIIRERTVVVAQPNPHPAPNAKHLVVRVPQPAMPAIPAQPADEVNVDVPAIDIHVPQVNVHVPPMHIHTPRSYAHSPHGNVNVPGGAGSNLIDAFSCSGCNFAHVNWAGKNLSGRSFVGADFSGANLEGANFSHANLSGVDFSRANLHNTDFRGAQLSGCTMRHADMTGAQFEGSHISGCGGVDARAMDQSQLRVWLSQCSGCDFSNADFHGMDLRGIRASGTNFQHANFGGADLSDAEFSGSNFSRANLAGARLNGTKFSGCNFSRTDLRNVDLANTSMNGSDLSSAIMR